VTAVSNPTRKEHVLLEAEREAVISNLERCCIGSESSEGMNTMVQLLRKLVPISPHTAMRLSNDICTKFGPEVRTALDKMHAEKEKKENREYERSESQTSQEGEYAFGGRDAKVLHVESPFCFFDDARSEATITVAQSMWNYVCA
jgi:hypothetical protein